MKKILMGLALVAGVGGAFATSSSAIEPGYRLELVNSQATCVLRNPNCSTTGTVACKYSGNQLYARTSTTSCQTQALFLP